jgi:hypothetical protein
LLAQAGRDAAERFIVYWAARIEQLQEMTPETPRPVRVPESVSTQEGFQLHGEAEVCAEQAACERGDDWAH